MPPTRIGRSDTARGSTRSAVEQRCALASAVEKTFDRVAARRCARRTPVVPGRRTGAGTSDAAYQGRSDDRPRGLDHPPHRAVARHGAPALPHRNLF